MSWFEDRWNDQWCIDISDELERIIQESWARTSLVPPYYIYLKIAYHLSEDARAGLTEFSVPKVFQNQLLDFQSAAVRIAARHINKIGGVIIGDVVGLGKTLMATALAKIFEEDYGFETLVICPKNLVVMWESYLENYRLIGRVMSLGMVQKTLPSIKRYRLVVIDESHNLRNREGKRFKSIQEYISKNDSKCILLSATPYNKSYRDLSSQLRLFISDEQDLGIRPEKFLRQIGEAEFSRRHQAPIRSLLAFDKSEYADDWRELMRLFLVRRTRQFIKNNYAIKDNETKQFYLMFSDGTKSIFPDRVPKTVRFEVNEQYSKMFADDVVYAINNLKLPRYGLKNYFDANNYDRLNRAEKKIVDDLSRAGKRLMGFCRTNLFKRLESSGYAFQLSVKRHIERNCIYLYAINNGTNFPIGTTDFGQFSSVLADRDIESVYENPSPNDNEEDQENHDQVVQLKSFEDFFEMARKVYELYTKKYYKRFRWISSSYFNSDLLADLQSDTDCLLRLIDEFDEWDSKNDEKLNELRRLINEIHPDEKILVFSQFADTSNYLAKELSISSGSILKAVTGSSTSPTDLAHKFSPQSNGLNLRLDDQLRVLISTDILSEGQNLQDCSIVVNYDLPWAIIRLIQRVGRVDRIGQKSSKILCYSFLPSDGVERIIKLRTRVSQRLRENAEVVGTDESFFEDETQQATLIDLYSEKEGVFDGEEDSEVDLSSYAYQIWKNATANNKGLASAVKKLPHVVHSTKSLAQFSSDLVEGVLVHLRTASGVDTLAWVDSNGNSITENQYEILQTAECSFDAQALPRSDYHHSVVQTVAKKICHQSTKRLGGQLGRPSGARFKVYQRLKEYAKQVQGTPFATNPLALAIEDLYNYPLSNRATEVLNRQLRTEISDQELVQVILSLRDEDRLCIVRPTVEPYDTQILCSLGLVKTDSV